jgi:hypothetical protein
MRKLDVALMGFPGEHLRFHPYVGAGFTMGAIATAEAQPPFANADQFNLAQAVFQEQKVGFSPLFIAGGQYRLSWASAFGQITVNPAQSNFLLYNGRPWNFSYEIGLRYNFGTSIDRN